MDEEKKLQAETEKKEKPVEKEEKQIEGIKEKPRKKKSKTVKRLLKIIALLVIVLIVVVVLFASALLKKTSVMPSTGAQEVAEQFEQYYGTIEGSFSYPSEYIPEMGACAVNEKTKESFCSYEMLDDPTYMYGVGYQLEVPTGTYTVYAQLADPNETGFDKDYKAYYSKFVTCGMSVECESHKAVEIEVKGGETLSDINPQDWYK